MFPAEVTHHCHRQVGAVFPVSLAPCGYTRPYGIERLDARGPGVRREPSETGVGA